MLEAIAFVGMLLGVLGRTASPYLRKIKEGAEIVWSQRYTASAIASLILCAITVALVFPAFTIPEGSLLAVFLAAFCFGFGINAVVNEVDKWKLLSKIKWLATRGKK